MNMKTTVAVAFAACAFAVHAGEELEKSIERGAKFLLSVQAEDGHWSDGQMPALTALPVWALCGVADAPSEAVEKASSTFLARSAKTGGSMSRSLDAAAPV